MVFQFNVGKQWKRISATLFVGIIFSLFWSQGPLNKSVEMANLVSNESAFLIPVFIQDQAREQQKGFGFVDDDQSREFDYGLLGKEKKTSSYGLIADPNHQAAMISEVGEVMHQRAKLFNPSWQSQLKSALDMFYVELSDSDGKFSGIYIESTGLTEHIKGYAGAITLGLYISSQGDIDAVYYLSSQETSSYLRQIADTAFYQQFSGITLDGESHKIDAVSGATISTQAMAKTITELLNKATESPLLLYLEEDPVGTNINAELTAEWIIHIAFIALCFIYFWQPWLPRTRSRTTAVMFLSILYIGFYLNNSFTYISLLHPFLGVSVSMLVGLYCVLVLLGAVWDNNTYCKFVCPYGNVQRLVARLLPNWRRVFFMPPRWVGRARTLLTFVLVSGVVLGYSEWASYELFPDLFGLEVSSFWFGVALVTILIASIYPMIWCRLLCPTGEVLDWLSDLVSPARVKKNKVSSTSCKQCTGEGCMSNRIKPI